MNIRFFIFVLTLSICFLTQAMDKELLELQAEITKEYFTDPTQTKIDLSQEDSFKNDDAHVYKYVFFSSRLSFSENVENKLKKLNITKKQFFSVIYNTNSNSKFSQEFYNIIEQELLNFDFFKKNYIDYIAFDIVPYDHSDKTINIGLELCSADLASRAIPHGLNVVPYSNKAITGKIVIKDIRYNEKKAQRSRMLAEGIRWGLGLFIVAFLAKKLS